MLLDGFTRRLRGAEAIIDAIVPCESTVPVFNAR